MGAIYSGSDQGQRRRDKAFLREQPVVGAWPEVGWIAGLPLSESVWDVGVTGVVGST